MLGVALLAALAAETPGPFRGTQHVQLNATHSVARLTRQAALPLTDWAAQVLQNSAARLQRVGKPVQPDEFWEFIHKTNKV